MNPLSAIYGGAVAVRNSLYDRGSLPVRRLESGVISIGNLAAGGSGKTPFVMMLAECLQARSVPLDILSRGYGRSSRGVLLVDPAGLPAEFGDEPLLLARRLQVPVVVGEDRYQAGLFAESKFGPQLHLLDDGFQHRGLARDFDIVLVGPQDIEDRLLPAGRLREPLTSLHRADAIVLPAGASDEPFLQFAKPIWRVRRNIFPENVPPNPVLFCGIARPQQFALQLRVAGVPFAAEAFFRDHHRYTEKDIRDLLQLKQKSCAGGFVTTEKDAINLGAYFSALEPLSVVPLKMEMENAADAVDTMLGTIEKRKRTA